VALTLVEKVLVLADVALFAETRTADLAHLAAAARENDVLSGEVIHREGDASDAMHVILSGRVRFQRENGAHAEAVKGAFGAFGLLDQRARTWTAKALEPTLLLSLERDAFVDVLSDHVNVGRGVLRVLAGRLRDRAERDGRPADAEDLEIG
jgi:CRP/FNR family cyclic AMP-dependent transcriptional regulator